MKKRASQWAAVTAYALTAVTVVRALLFIARLGGVIGTIEGVAEVAGYGQAVTDFEDTVDAAVHWLVSVVVSPA